MKRPINFFIQARLGSTRLPGKVLRRFSNGKTLLEMVVRAVRSSKFADDSNIVVLTSELAIDDPLCDAAASLNLKVFRGDEKNVLHRFTSASQLFPSEFIVRVCCDNPFLQPLFLDELISDGFAHPSYDYFSHQAKSGKPVIQCSFGLFGELFTSDAMQKMAAAATDQLDIEHVTRYFYMHPDAFKIRFLKVPETLDEGSMRFTLDTEEDFMVADQLLQDLDKDGLDCGYESLLKILVREREMQKIMARNISISIKK